MVILSDPTGTPVTVEAPHGRPSARGADWIFEMIESAWPSAVITALDRCRSRPVALPSRIATPTITSIRTPTTAISPITTSRATPLSPRARRRTANVVRFIIGSFLVSCSVGRERCALQPAVAVGGIATRHRRGDDDARLAARVVRRKRDVEKARSVNRLTPKGERVAIRGHDG